MKQRTLNICRIFNLKIVLSSTILSVFFFSGFSQVDAVGSEKMKMNISGNSLKIPYFSNHSLEVSRSDISRAVVVLHGVERNASDYYNNMITSTFMRPTLSDSTVIIAPQFLTEEDINFHKLDKEHLYWTEGGWTSGSNSRSESTNPRPARIASLAVLDSVMSRIISTFPNLRSIVFAGHSAGGQVVNRYSAASTFPDVLCEKNNVITKFIVANPSSYVYMDNKRAVSGKMDQFEVPNNDCSGYNDWKFGLDNLFTYPATTGRGQIRNFLGKRNIAYLVGELDNNPNSSSLDNSCEARLQGRHRLERGIIYFNYLKNYYGEEILKLQTLDIIPNAGHDNFKMFTSEKGLFHLFESRPQNCKQTASSTNESAAQHEMELFPNPASSELTMKVSENGGAVTIYNIHGIKLKSIPDISDQEVRIDISDFSPGLYLLSYRHGAEIKNKLFVKTE
jgi:hypothetical protein